MEERFEPVGRGIGLLVEQGLQAEKGGGVEGPALAFPLDQEPDGDRLDPSGREAGGDLLPEQGGEGVADQAVEDPAGLLGPDQVQVEFPGDGEGVLDRLGGNFVEDHPPDRAVGLEDLGQVPADRFAFPVLVRRQVEFGGVLDQLFQGGYRLLLGRRDDVERREVVFDIDPHPGPGLALDGGGDLGGGGGKIADVAEGRLHPVPVGKEGPDCPGLGRGFDYNQFFH